MGCVVLQFSLEFFDSQIFYFIFFSVFIVLNVTLCYEFYVQLFFGQVHCPSAFLIKISYVKLISPTLLSVILEWYAFAVCYWYL